MVFPRPPGVYFERADAPASAVEEARSDIAGFIGITERGPLHQPVRVESLTQFFTRFGRGSLEFALLPTAVHGFFANGGRTAWIVRVGNRVDVSEHGSVFLVDEQHRPVFRVWAKDPGQGGSAISIRIRPAVRNGFHLTVIADADGNSRERLEAWRDLSADPYSASTTDSAIPSNDRYVARVINNWNSSKPPVDRKQNASSEFGSVLIVVQELFPGNTIPRRVVGVCPPDSIFTQGQPANPSVVSLECRLGWGDVKNSTVPQNRRSVLDALTKEHFIGDETNQWGLSALEAVDEVAVVAMPDLMWQSNTSLQHVPKRRRCDPIRLPDQNHLESIETRAALEQEDQRWAQLKTLNHCARMRNRFAILDSPFEFDAVQVQEWAKKLHSEDGQFGALYYSWLGVATARSGVRWVPPSGHMAGLFARVDLSSGVQKSPANEVLSEVQDVRHDVSDEAHGQLNIEGVNVLKASGTRGVRAMGARTLIDPHVPEQQPWRFVAVRRLLIMLEKSLARSAFSLVHTDNRPERWRDVERVIRNFLWRQWQMGRLGGTTPEEAFSVECDESTNPWEDVQLGRMTCVIGVQPPLPAEFVFIRIGDRGGDVGTWNLGESNE